MEDLAHVAKSLDITFVQLTPTGELGMYLTQALMNDVRYSYCAD
jgi:hypothetical protein